MLRTSDIRNGRINLDNLNCVSHEIFEKWTRRGKLEKGDIIFTREAPLGEVGLVKNPDNYFLGQRLILFRANQEICDNRFLLYSLMYHDNKQAIIAKGVGSTVLHLRVPECEKITISAPELPIQRRIADILSAYDDLIENNRKQIKLLEEAAQRLYKEWFVDFHFPGHERIKTVNNPPEDWTMGMLQQIANFKRGKAITKVQVQEGNIPVVAGGLEPAYYHNVANTKAPVITVSGSGANAGFTRMYYTDVFASDCSFVDASASDFLPFVYCFLKSNRSKLDTLQKGAAQPHVYAKDINALELYVPSHNLLQRFCDITRPLFAKIGVLEQQSIELSQARDRLLPMLMNQDIKI